MTTTVCFAHGKESGPWGRKISALADVARQRGLAVMSPDYRFTMDPDERVAHLLGQHLPPGDNLILVGSSMGGYVSAVASGTLRPRGLFLLAPAVDIPGYPGDTTPRAGLTEVVHGWHDTIIPPETVVGWAQRHTVRLHLVDSEHTLTDHIEWLCRAFDAFLTETGAGKA
ncbi:alpha/beta hydrolase [Aquisalimonas asiatica]|uniref:Alpha/beta superfamily hydrolase n=1 Tax=Aquisalimonas asiatica TaxID=406100 RepID=A0A1H8V7H5_9GAMM|nr:alpha/beta hydrolase [Aquisalimonas asiatica]SEP11410.1 Alpha/beta superfamily hydrolase [Aquisalimonas asiatica]